MSRGNLYSGPGGDLFRQAAVRVFFMVGSRPTDAPVTMQVSGNPWQSIAARGRCACCSIGEKEVGEFFRHRAVQLQKSGVVPVLINPMEGGGLRGALASEFGIRTGITDFQPHELSLACGDELIVAYPKDHDGDAPADSSSTKLRHNFDIEIVRFGCPNCLPNSSERLHSRAGFPNSFLVGDVNNSPFGRPPIFGFGSRPETSGMPGTSGMSGPQFIDLRLLGAGMRPKGEDLLRILLIALLGAAMRRRGGESTSP